LGIALPEFEMKMAVGGIVVAESAEVCASAYGLSDLESGSDRLKMEVVNVYRAAAGVIYPEDDMTGIPCRRSGVPQGDHCAVGHRMHRGAAFPGQVHAVVHVPPRIVDARTERGVHRVLGFAIADRPDIGRGLGPQLGRKE